MPSIYEYLGILILFYSNEHEPIHVHAKKGGFESKVEFEILDGKIENIRITTIKNRKPLQGNDLKNLKVFIKYYGQDIINKWIDYFVMNKEVKFEKISRKLK
jgi:hypothetical protein